ncbi:Mediator of RNA polymerase II transcription subunit 10 [Entomophthora muscae]|uniref:Mediator of RNA polymerase II transcription subunit 10 n=1 Tax=Entomophthora muscae TaxID=34485 RepID=A0ACC2RU60_9FUNG|nr:Mediator of RNA polymerase II transcription subunit 10 [Entomophthora muscae]
MSEERSQRKKRAAVEAELLKANATLHALGVTIIEHEGEQSNIMIGKRMNEIASCYQKIDELSEQIDIQVPFDFLQYLDDGKNPMNSHEIISREPLQKINSLRESFRPFRTSLLFSKKRCFLAPPL